MCCLISTMSLIGALKTTHFKTVKKLEIYNGGTLVNITNMTVFAMNHNINRCVYMMHNSGMTAPRTGAMRGHFPRHCCSPSPLWRPSVTDTFTQPQCKVGRRAVISTRTLCLLFKRYLNQFNSIWNHPKYLAIKCWHYFAGKLFCMLYSLVGIPLLLVFMANIGDLMANGFRWMYR